MLQSFNIYYDIIYPYHDCLVRYYNQQNIVPLHIVYKCLSIRKIYQLSCHSVNFNLQNELRVRGYI